MEIVSNKTIFNKLLIKSIFLIKRTNSWLDVFRAILVCFETNKFHLKTMKFICFKEFCNNFK